MPTPITQGVGVRSQLPLSVFTVGLIKTAELALYRFAYSFEVSSIKIKAQNGVYSLPPSVLAVHVR